MATVVVFHAHPDDEPFTTAGRMRASADAGHRLIGVLATGGEGGEEADPRDLAAVRARRLRRYEESSMVLGGPPDPGSGRMVGTADPLTDVDVCASAGARRAALDAYDPGLGTADLAELVRVADPRAAGDGVLSRAIHETEGRRPRGGG